MYEPSKHIATFNIAGFQHYDGALVLNKLAPGKKLKLVHTPDNPYDPNAIELRYKGTKLGYVPASQNAHLAAMMFYGHGKAFQARVLQVDPTAEPWHQVLVGIYITDAR